MQYEGLITFSLLQLVAMATEPHYAAITCRGSILESLMTQVDSIQCGSEHEV